MVACSRFACALLLAGAALQAACASMCKEMAADRTAFFARRTTATAPHATVVVPFPVADRLIARRLGALHPIGSPISLPGRVGSLLGAVRLAPRRVAMRPAPDDRLGLRVELEVLAGDTALAALSLDLDLRPAIDPETGVLRAALRADDLRSIRPTVDPGAAERLAGAIRSRLPSLARSVISEGDLAALARGSIDYLARHLGALLVDSGLLAPLGELTAVSVAIPVVPVSRLSLHSTGQALVIAVFTRLPAAAGVEMRTDRRSDPQAVQLRLSAAAIAELGNRALATGLLPRRYDDHMRPKKDGDFTPGLRFAGGRRPFKIIAWRLRSPCLRVRIGADPTVALRGGVLVVGFEHGEVEEVRGAMLVRARVWLKRLGADAIRVSKQTLASARISIAGVPISGTIHDAFYRSGEIGIDLLAE